LVIILLPIGYTIFVVFGELPECDADRLFRALPRGEDGKYIEEEIGYKLGASDLNEEESVRRGIQLSLAKTPAEALRAQRAAFLDRLAAAASSASKPES
jgi:hypothetical protein